MAAVPVVLGPPWYAPTKVSFDKSSILADIEGDYEELL
jgi:hypothetical protein